MSLADRRQYHRGTLEASDLAEDPIAQFAAWFEEAESTGASDANAMTLATSTVDGVPSARIVLLKGFDARGFVFYTDYRSRKGAELAANPRAALLCYWSVLERQVRITGPVTRTDPSDAMRYFATRPRESQLGAWASTQSAPLPDRAALEERLRDVTVRFGSGDIPLPPHWGGYRVEPTAMEFWQGREGRLHDRFLYLARPDGWTVQRLSP